MKEAENALWGEKKTKGWSGVSHFAFAFRSSGQYWGEMVSGVGSTGGRWSLERPTGLEKIVHGPALPPLHESSILALYSFVSKA